MKELRKCLSKQKMSIRWRHFYNLWQTSERSVSFNRKFTAATHQTSSWIVKKRYSSFVPVILQVFNKHETTSFKKCKHVVNRNQQKRICYLLLLNFSVNTGCLKPTDWNTFSELMYVNQQQALSTEKHAKYQRLWWKYWTFPQKPNLF